MIEQCAYAVSLSHLTRDLQTLLQQSRRLCIIALRTGRAAQMGERLGDGRLVPQLARDLQAVVVEGAGLGVIALVQYDNAQVAQRQRCAGTVAELPGDGETLLGEVIRCRIVSLKVSQHARPKESTLTDRIGLPSFGPDEET